MASEFEHDSANPIPNYHLTFGELPAHSPMRPTESKVPAPLASLRVLLVEDSPGPQRVHLAILRSAGADVALECNGQAAVKTALAVPPAIDVLILDLVETLDGINAVRELRQNGFVNPIIALVENGDDAAGISWIQAGCDASLSKPVSTSSLIDAITRLASSVDTIWIRRPKMPSADV